MNHQINERNKRIMRKVNAGFTLVEMIVVLTIMAIMMGAAVWGVTGWIAHYEYISSEQKAKTIYMAAQSALSAAQRRGTLDEYMDSFKGDMVKFAKNPGDSGLDKATYGIPTDPDNEGEIHDYGYLVVNKNDYINHPEKKLFKMLESYVSDSEQLNASIVVEFDITAGKVYSAFYSNWSTSLLYGSEECVERDKFYINGDRRTPEFRQGYQVGYYGADQVNVVKLDNLPQLKADCMLHNEETLYLTMSSDDDNAEENVDYKVSLYEDPNTIISTGGFFGMFGDPSGDPGEGSGEGAGDGSSGAGGDENVSGKKLLCYFSFDKSILGYSDTDNNVPKRVEMNVFDAENNDLGPYPFILKFNKYKDEDGKDQEEFSLELDALITGENLALLDDIDKVTQRTDKSSYSITRLIGTDPKNIFARVSVEPKIAGIYSSGAYKDSNTENALFGSKVKDYKDNKYFNDPSAYLIVNNRHFANITYTENYSATEDKGYNYGFVGDIDWKKAVIYNDPSNLATPVDMSKDIVSFPMITKLGKSSAIDGDGNQYSNLVLTNSSGVSYAHDENGKVVPSTVTGKPVNIAKTLGIVGVNKGKIKRLIIDNASVEALSYEDYSKKPENSGITEATKKAICFDTLEAVGLLCGRNEGSLLEIYFNKDCSIKATVFATLKDTDEAKLNGVELTDAHINQKFGCGVGMAAGTVVLSDDSNIDRIRTSGKITANIGCNDDIIKEFIFELPDIDSDARSNIYDETKDVNGYSNAQYYSYGIGGVFGYVYGGEYKKGVSKAGIGVERNTVKINKAANADDANAYHEMKHLFDDWEDQSIVNKTDVEGTAFTGGIVGNIFTSELQDNMSIERDVDNDITIPVSDENSKAIAQIINCYNYGDTKGVDFVGGVVGVNGKGGYITECASYGSPSATGGVSAGITSENYGYIKDCIVDRAPADEDNADDHNVNQPYIPIVNGNMTVAGAITSVNHSDCVVMNCKCAIATIKDADDNPIQTPISISGNEMDTFGYLVGENLGVVNGGKAGEHIGYSSKKTRMIIGGAVGTNQSNAVIKNVTVTAKLSDKGEAECIGGVVGLNLSKVKNCKFGGIINKNKGISTKMTIGGIAGRNGNASTAGKNGASLTKKSSITGCYLIGANLDVKGICSFVDTDSSDAKISKSSSVGGVCGINYADASVDKCYITSLGAADSTGNAVRIDNNGNETNDGSGTYKIERQSVMKVLNGMAGGIAGVNYGEITNSGYTDKVFYDDGEKFAITKDTENSRYTSSNSTRSDEMSFFVKAVDILDKVDNPDTTVSRKAVIDLNKHFIDDEEGGLNSNAEALCGYLTNDEAKYQYALPKYETSDETSDDASNHSHWNAYNSDTNTFILTRGYKDNNGNDVKGRGSIGGICAFNTEYGVIDTCASGRWLVEDYMPKGTYNAVGGIIGINTADSDNINNLVNFAYVRIENPIIYKNSDNMVLTGSGVGQENNYKARDNRFYYLAGVIGTQYNRTKTDWTVNKCVNAGTVVNYYGNNVGGVLGQVCGMGGTVQYCYNYGLSMTGYATKLSAGYSGQSGGVISHYTKLEPGQVSNILHCQNHGVVSFAMQGVDYDTSIVKDIRGNAMSNEVGGVLGGISAPNAAALYTVNIIDCVNGKCAKVYSGSKSGGIIGQIGSLIYDLRNTNGDKSYADGLFVNIDSCRNYSSNFRSASDGSRTGVEAGSELRMKGGGIYSGRNKYDVNNKDGWTGYTSVRNCFSVRMMGDNSSGTYGESGQENNKNGIIAYAKINNPYNNINTLEYRTLKYCGNNYYLDESSFQYTEKRGYILADGYHPDATKQQRDSQSIVQNDASKVNARIALSKPANPDNAVTGVVKNSIIGKINDYSLYLDDYSRNRIASRRIVTAAYGEGDNEKYVLFVEPDGVSMDSVTEKNAWIDDEEEKVCINTASGIVKTSILEKGVVEGKNSAPYSNKLINHFYLERIKKSDSFRSEEESLTGQNLSGKVDATRLPIIDEYELDYYKLDTEFMKYIDECKALGPDTVYNVNVKENDEYGYYDVRWDIKSNDENTPSATKFDMLVQYFRIPETEAFDFGKMTTDYLNKEGVYYVPYEGDDKPVTVYGTKTNFVQPSSIKIESGYKYYAVVRVKDSRDTTNNNNNYSIIENTDAVINEETHEVITPAVKSYIELTEKLPTPEFEIVEYTVKNGNTYKNKWMLHLKNAKDFVGYAGKTGFEVGAYSLNSNNKIDTSKLVKMTGDYIIDGSGNLIENGLLNNAIDIGGKFSIQKADYKLYGYAKADNCLTSDLYEFTVYIPKLPDNTNTPDADYSYTYTETDKETLNSVKGRPEYSGTLTYNQLNNNTGNNQPTVPQIFRLELYGVKTETDEYGDITKKWHETVAYKDYPVSIGENEDINIGYYDVDKSVNLSAYDSFGIECWYASPGQGNVYNYFELTDTYKEQVGADRTVRSSGYISDLSRIVKDEPVYYFHSTELPTPELKYICMGRKRSDAYASSLGLNDSGQSPEWYVAITNAHEYPSGTKINRSNGNAVIIDDTHSSGNAVLDKLYPYAAPLQTGWSSNQYWAEKEGSVPSKKVKYSPNNNNTSLFRENNLRNNLNVNISTDLTSYTDDDGNSGCFKLAADNTLTFRGTIHYNTQNIAYNSGIKQYYRYEIYAYNKVRKQTETIYLSPDMEMNNISINNDNQNHDNVEIVIDGDDNNIHIADYQDFHFAVWYSKSAIHVAENDTFTYHYTEISESVAKSFDCYDKTNDVFNNARANGLLIDVSKIDPVNNITKPTYYYVTPLADKTYGDGTFTSNYTKYVLYRELNDTISAIQKNPDNSDNIWSEGETIKYVKWLMCPTYYSDNEVSDVECNLYMKVYRYPVDGSVPTKDTLDENNYYYEYTDEAATSPYRIDTLEDKEYDWNAYRYYALVKVKDANIESDDAYSSSILVEMAKPLPTPKLSYVPLGWDGCYIHLDNYADYADCDGKVEVVIKYSAFPNAEYIIDVNGNSYSWRKTKSGVPITYTNKETFDKFYNEHGETFTLEAYAREFDRTTNEIVNSSARKFKKIIYVPTGNNPAPDGTKLSLNNTNVVVSPDKSSVTFTSDIGFTCTSKYAPKDEQGFTIALVGTPKTDVLGSTKPAILSRTNDKGLMLSAGETKNGQTFVFNLADGVDLDDYKDFYIYIWYSHFGADGYVHPEVRLTSEEFNQYKDKEGVVVDLSEGINNAIYFFERVFGYKDEKPKETNNDNVRGSIRYKFNID